MACKRITTAHLLYYRRPKKKERTLPQRLLTCWSANALSIPSTVHVSERGTVVFWSQIQLSAPSMLSSVTFTACSCQQSESIAHLIEYGNYSMIYCKIVLRKKMHQFTLKRSDGVPTWVFKQGRKNQLLWEILNVIMLLVREKLKAFVQKGHTCISFFGPSFISCWAFSIHVHCTLFLKNE